MNMRCLELFSPALMQPGAEHTGIRELLHGWGTLKGQVSLFPWAGNVSSVSQVVALTNGLQRAAGDIPLLIGVDQENGRVSRLDPQGHSRANPMAVAVGGSEGRPDED